MADLLDELLATQPADRIVHSRASWLTAAETAGVPTVRCPVIGGQTVWDAVAQRPGDLWVVEVPNYFGRFEHDTPSGNGATPYRSVAIRRFGTAPLRMPVIETATAAPDGAARAAHRIAGALRQLPGITLAHGMPVSPWFVVLLPADAAAAARALASHGYPGCVPLETSYPELPGGLRIAVAWPETRNDGFITTLRGWLNATKG